MIISPIYIIIVSAIIIATGFFYIINKPNKPIFSGMFLILLLINVFLTFAINIYLSASNAMLTNETSVINVIVAFITMTPGPTTEVLEESFSLFCKFDIALIILSVLTGVFEMRSLFKPNTNIIQEENK
ncbi:MAG: hypothetical protein U0O22_00820 [Acutalibacteraceae bacterium]